MGHTRSRWLAVTPTAAFLVLSTGTALGGGGKDDYKPFREVAEGYEKVVSTADGSKPLYEVWIDKKKNQLLAELPSGWAGQKHFIAVTQSAGSVFAGLQGPTRYVYWRQYDKRLALMSPENDTRSNGEPQSKSSV